ncbi:MAG: HzsA-related protein, partial [Planctomycetota bacterium]
LIDDGHWYANIGYYAHDENEKVFSSGSQLCVLDLKTGQVNTLLKDDRGTFRDPAVHYDGAKILFSYRKGGSDHFHLYEMDVNGDNLTQLTTGPHDDYEPAYLPDGGITFVSTRANRWVGCWLTHVGTVYRCDADGGDIQELSSNLEHDNTPWPLPDGRVMYQRWEYIDRSQVRFHHLWTMNPDGTDQRILYGNMHPGSVFIDAKPVPDSREVILIDSPGHGRKEHEGFVALLTDENGPDDPASLKHLTKIGYRDPYALSKDLFIAARKRDLVALTRDGQEHPLFKLTEPRFPKERLLHEPRPVTPQQREVVLPSHTDENQETGTMLLANVYIGRKMDSVPKGSIKKLLIMEPLAKPINYTGGMDPLTYGGSFMLERVLGTVPVEPDGSAHFKVPARRPIFFIALDANDNSVKRMHSFTSVMPGETTSCIGCHEERNTVLAANLPSPLAARRPPSAIRKIEGIPEVFDFPRDIQPILDKHCVECHNPQQRDGNVLLTGDRGPMFSHSYYTLTIRRQFADGRNREHANYEPYAVGAAASPLMQKLRGEHYGAQLSEAEIKTIRYWIEAAATYPGTYAALGTGMIGGYQQNKPAINNELEWPTSRMGAAAINHRCAPCHNKRLKLPRILADESGISFWKPSLDDPALHGSRHIVFNLTHPEQSLILLGPLAREAGGYGACYQVKPNGQIDRSVDVFKDTGDPYYQAILAMIQAGKDRLDRIKRFDMPGFQPRPEYLREMKRFGILPESFDPATDKVDPYELDERYWRSLWHKPPAGE